MEINDLPPSFTPITVKEQLLPCYLQVNQVCYLQFRPDDKPFTATVIGVRFYQTTVKYDLRLFWDDHMGDVVEQETRIYNVHSKYLTPA